MTTHTAGNPLSAASSSPASPGSGSAPEFLAWAMAHARDNRRHAAELAQITQHPEIDAAADARGQQKAWARRRTQERRLHASALHQMRR